MPGRLMETQAEDAQAPKNAEKALKDTNRPCAWDILEHRIFGAPGETYHRVLWVETYIRKDGTHPDLDYLLDAATKPGGIDGGARTISIRPMFYAT